MVRKVEFFSDSTGLIRVVMRQITEQFALSSLVLTLVSILMGIRP